MTTTTVIQKKVDDFNQLLNSIDSLADKKKTLWKEIYENAVTDRENALSLYTQLVQLVEGKSTEHSIHGQNLTRYLERMNKSNDQLIRLAELIAEAEKNSTSTSVNIDDVYDKIKKGK